MPKHFLTDINIGTYKCFQDFQVGGFKRLNLIIGKNNIGKTALMEAIFINAHASEIRYVVSAIIGVKFMRENLNLLAGNTLEDRHIFLSQFKKIRLKSSVAELEFEVLDNDGIKQYQFIINELESVVNANELNLNPCSFRFK